MNRTTRLREPGLGPHPASSVAALVPTRALAARSHPTAHQHWVELKKIPGGSRVDLTQHLGSQGGFTPSPQVNMQLISHLTLC